MIQIKRKLGSFLLILTIMFAFVSSGLCDPGLVEGVGYGAIILKKSTLSDLRNYLGSEDEIEKTKSSTSNNYIYRKLGLKFNIDSARCAQPNCVYSISTLPNFSGATAKGISLKSTLADIEAAYGKDPLIHPKTTKDRSNVWSYPEIGVHIWFQKDSNFKFKRNIKTITITFVTKRPSKEFMDNLRKK